MLTIQDVRTNVAVRVQCADSTIIPDILSDAQTHDNLILALDTMTCPADKAAFNGQPGQGHKVLVTALHRDHHDDGDLGPHGHNPHGAPGWACDFGTVDGVDVGDNHATRQFVRDCISNSKITKVGTTASVANQPDLQAFAAQHNTLLFVDEGTGLHVHIQSSESV